ncbi:unnamed protein product [Pedinophyceae sp. YPF-701]|nr:unnamed protein product [Pedinophyceae sp. YPF-701]
MATSNHALPPGHPDAAPRSPKREDTKLPFCISLLLCGSKPALRQAPPPRDIAAEGDQLQKYRFSNSQRLVRPRPACAPLRALTFRQPARGRSGPARARAAATTAC